MRNPDQALLLCSHIFTGKFRWLHDGVFVDLDGSLTGTVAGAKVLPWSDTLNPSKCQKDARFGFVVEGAVCDDTARFARLSLNK